MFLLKSDQHYHSVIHSNVLLTCSCCPLFVKDSRSQIFTRAIFIMFYIYFTYELSILPPKLAFLHLIPSVHSTYCCLLSFFAFFNFIEILEILNVSMYVECWCTNRYWSLCCTVLHRIICDSAKIENFTLVLIFAWFL